MRSPVLPVYFTFTICLSGFGDELEMMRYLYNLGRSAGFHYRHKALLKGVSAGRTDIFPEREFLYEELGLTGSMDFPAVSDEDDLVPVVLDNGILGEKQDVGEFLKSIGRQSCTINFIFPGRWSDFVRFRQYVDRMSNADFFHKEFGLKKIVSKNFDIKMEFFSMGHPISSRPKIVFHVRRGDTAVIPFTIKRKFISCWEPGTKGSIAYIDDPGQASRRQISNESIGLVLEAFRQSFSGLEPLIIVVTDGCMRSFQRISEHSALLELSAADMECIEKDARELNLSLEKICTDLGVILIQGETNESILKSVYEIATCDICMSTSGSFAAVICSSLGVKSPRFGYAQTILGDGFNEAPLPKIITKIRTFFDGHLFNVSKHETPSYIFLDNAVSRLLAPQNRVKDNLKPRIVITHCLYTDFADELTRGLKDRTKLKIIDCRADLVFGSRDSDDISSYLNCLRFRIKNLLGRGGSLIVVMDRCATDPFLMQGHPNTVTGAFLQSTRDKLVSSLCLFRCAANESGVLSSNLSEAKSIGTAEPKGVFRSYVELSRSRPRVLFDDSSNRVDQVLGEISTRFGLEYLADE